MYVYWDCICVVQYFSHTHTPTPLHPNQRQPPQTCTTTGQCRHPPPARGAHGRAEPPERGGAAAQRVRCRFRLEAAGGARGTPGVGARVSFASFVMFPYVLKGKFCILCDVSIYACPICRRHPPTRTTHSPSLHQTPNRPKLKAQGAFIIRHYAGPVCYSPAPPPPSSSSASFMSVRGF